LRHPGAVEPPGEHPLAVLADGHALVDQVPPQLPHVEGVAARLGVDRAGQRRRWRLPVGAGQVVGDLPTAQPAEGDELAPGLPAEDGEGVDQRVPEPEGGVAVGAGEQQPAAAGEPAAVRQELEGVPVGPVQVVEDQHDRPPARHGHQELRHGVEQPEPLLLRAQLGQEPGEHGRPGSQGLAEVGGAERPHGVAEHLGPGP
jgi:hypothetical protein